MKTKCAEQWKTKPYIVEGEWIGNDARDPYIYAYYAILYRHVSLLLFLEAATSLAYDVTVN